MSNHTFFRFLQVAIGTNHQAFALSEQEWGALLQQCQRQALIGIGYKAVEQFHAQGFSCPKALLLQWALMAQKIEARNVLLERECVRITQQLVADGFECCILKGQSNLAYYPNDLGKLRQSGDIDVWVYPSAESAHPVQVCLAYARSKGGEVRPLYYHVHIYLSEVVKVELHYRLSFLCNPWRNRRFQQWSRQQMRSCMHADTAKPYNSPPASFNLVYQLIHMYRHFFEYGIGLRHLMDYYFLLHSVEKNHSSHEFSALQEATKNTLKRLGLWKFGCGISWCLNEVFEGNHSSKGWLLCPENIEEGKLILNEAILGGNFGQHHTSPLRTLAHRPLQRAWFKTMRLLRFVAHEPLEVCSVPLFRLWHYAWRRFRWWRF